MNNIGSKEQQYQKPSTCATLGGIITGGLISYSSRIPSNVISSKIIARAENICKSLSKDEFKQIDKAINNAINTPELKQNGVEILKATDGNYIRIHTIIKENINKLLEHIPISNKQKQSISNGLAKKMYISAKSGSNACYISFANKILIPGKGLNIAGFHEMGHALNGISKCGRILQRTHIAGLFMLPVIGLTALIKTKKAPGEKPEGNFDKATTFVKNNAGALTFAAFIPTLLEEGLASIKGNKLAKQFLSPELAQKVAKANKFAFLTYLTSAIISSVGLHYGVKVKDYIASKKPVNEN